ncbi:monocarboxylate transporter 2-like [Anneissia japonica]|uniref:monocarboxylate transporter 2-like n=1 Tax=Anneissia japonica TaxID=1529436 RepID=UPI00142564A4|nr:monocarboxylate transporter 2-like [Anneissia japonica]XP_033115473.1 monocarboxylate transporter 2-like [Anneissia japonica]XP_033115474.1 monocarboxylate transporter 2-like [Anneissia japonica]
MAFPRCPTNVKKNLPMLLAIPLVHFLTFGQTDPFFGVFLVDFKEKLGCSSAAIGMAHSVFLGFKYLLGPLPVILTNRFGSRLIIILGCTMMSSGLMLTSHASKLWHVYISHSLITGCGSCLVFQSVTYVIGHRFDKSASLYFALMYAGSSTGFFLTPLFCSAVRKWFGWQGTILILGSIAMNSIPIAMIAYKVRRVKTTQKYTSETGVDTLNDLVPSLRSQTEDGVDSQPEKIHTLSLFIKFPRLMIMIIVRLLAEFGFSGFFVHFNASIIYKGFLDEDAAVVFFAFGIGSFVGRLGSPLPGYLGIISNYKLFTIALFVAGIAMFSFNVLMTLTSLVLSALAIGLFIGLYSTLFPVVMRSCVSMDRFKDAYSVVGIPAAFACIFGGYAMGVVYDISGSYNVSLFIAGSCFLLSGSLMLMTDFFSKLKRKLFFNEITGLDTAVL